MEVVTDLVIAFCVVGILVTAAIQWQIWRKNTAQNRRNEMLRVANGGSLERLLQVLREAGIVEARSFGGDGVGSESDFDGKFLAMFDPALLGQAIASWIHASEDGKRARSRNVAEELAASSLTDKQIQCFIEATRLHSEVRLQLQEDFLVAKADLEREQQKRQSRAEHQRTEKKNQKILRQGLKACGANAPEISAEVPSDWDI